MQYDFQEIDRIQTDYFVPDYVNMPKLGNTLSPEDEFAVRYFCGKAESGEIVSLSVWSPIAGLANTIALRYLAVRPEFRGQGYGKDMLYEACRVLKAEGISVLYTRLIGNKAAIFSTAPFLLSVGFYLLTDSTDALFADDDIYMQEYALAMKHVPGVWKFGKTFVDQYYPKVLQQHLRQKQTEDTPLLETTEKNTNVMMCADFWTPSNEADAVIKSLLFHATFAKMQKEAKNLELLQFGDEVAENVDEYEIQAILNRKTMWKTTHLLDNAETADAETILEDTEDADEVFAKQTTDAVVRPKAPRKPKTEKNITLSNLSVSMFSSETSVLKELFSAEIYKILGEVWCVCMGVFSGTDCIGAMILSISEEGNGFKLQGINVLENCRNKGAGSMLMNAAIRDLLSGEGQKILVSGLDQFENGEQLKHFLSKFSSVEIR